MSTRREFLLNTAAAGVAATSAVGLSKADARSPARSRSKDGVINLAIVGVGQISPRYFKQVADSQRARFVATCARTLEEAKARALEYGVGAWYDDYTAMYDAVKPDGVVIATPNS